MNSSLRTALTIAVATAIPTGIVFFLLRPAQEPSFATQLALASVEDRLDEIEDSLALLAEQAEEAEERGFALARRPLASNTDAPDDDEEAGDDDEEDFYLDDAQLVSRLTILETRLRALEEDPIQRGFLYLQSASPELRRQGLQALERIAENDPVALQAIRALLNDPDDRVRVSTLDTLADIEDREAVGLAANLLADGSPSVRREAVEALTRLGGAEYAEQIAGLVTDEDARVREEAADSLGRLKSPAALPSLIAALGDSEEDVRGEAIASLGEIGAKEALPALRQIWETDPGPHRSRLLEAMRELGDEQPMQNEVARLSNEAVSAESADTRRRALRSLANYSREEVRNIFERALQDPSPEVRREAERALRRGRGR